MCGHIMRTCESFAWNICRDAPPTRGGVTGEMPGESVPAPQCYSPLHFISLCVYVRLCEYIGHMECKVKCKPAPPPQKKERNLCMNHIKLSGCSCVCVCVCPAETCRLCSRSLTFLRRRAGYLPCRKSPNSCLHVSLKPRQ